MAWSDRPSWQQTNPDVPTALMLDYLNMSGAIYLNGTLLARDAHLAEPLTRTWNTPRYLLLPFSLLHAGANTLFVRVSGIAIYGGGPGKTAIGAPGPIRARFSRIYLVRDQLSQVGVTISVMLGCLLLPVWLAFRKETIYGWLAVASFTWGFCIYNNVATSSWPFASTDSWARLNTVTLLTVFILRFCDLHWLRYERLVWYVCLLCSVALILAPHAQIENARNLLTTFFFFNYYGAGLVFGIHAWRSKRGDYRIFAGCIAIVIAIGFCDTLVFLNIIPDYLFYSPMTSPILMVAMTILLARRFAESRRRIEHFNQELIRSTDVARAELADTLQRQHELEVTNTRLAERVRFSHELHDGLGSMIFSGIATLERAPGDVPRQHVMSILKDLRDSLRFVIDSNATPQNGLVSLAELLAPLRHRMARVFDAQGIGWRRQQDDSIDDAMLPQPKSLNVLRILQEALINVLRHAHASRVEVGIHQDDQGLRLGERDNGVGIPADADATHLGTGVRSMRARAGKLGATLDIQSSPGSTSVVLRIPVPARTSGENAPDGVLRGGGAARRIVPGWAPGASLIYSLTLASCGRNHSAQGSAREMQGVKRKMPWWVFMGRSVDVHEHSGWRMPDRIGYETKACFFPHDPGHATGALAIAGIVC